MIAEERYKNICLLLQKNKVVRIADLCKLLSTTPETIRRDLSYLEKKDQLKKVHGGAVLVQNDMKETSFGERYNENFKEKQIIASFTQRFINEKDTIMLDASSTTYCMIKFIKHIKNITVITNSLKALEVLSKISLKTIGVGGELDNSVGAFVGLQTLATLGIFYPTHCFISCHGFDMKLGMMDISPEEAAAKEKMLLQASKKYVLIDHSKLGKRGVVKINGIKSIDYFITDRKPSDEWISVFDDLPGQLVYLQDTQM